MLLVFFYFKLFICPPDVKRSKFSVALFPELSPGFSHESLVELTTPQEPHLHFTTFKNLVIV